LGPANAGSKPREGKARAERRRRSSCGLPGATMGVIIELDFDQAVLEFTGQFLTYTRIFGSSLASR